VSSSLSSNVVGATPTSVADQSRPGARASGPTYGHILKSSALIGGSSVTNLLFGLVRAKVMAVLLGPAGVGLLGLYTSIVDLTYSLAGVGVNSSGVRQIAEAAGSGDTLRIAQTVAVVRRAAALLGIAGAVVLIALATPVSTLTFRSDAHAGAVALLSLVVLFRLIADGQTAVLQGVRRIRDLAALACLGSLFSTLTMVPLVYWFGSAGLVPALAASAAMTCLASWWYGARVPTTTVSLSIAQVARRAGPLLRLGLAFMASGALTMGAAYVVRTIVLRTLGVDAAGLYQAASVLGGLYVGIVLQAMGSDFYPRLTAVATDDAECNRIVNEQTHVSVLLAGPGVIGTLTLAPIVTMLFYSTTFVPAVDALRWICLGMALRVVTWPMGFIVLARGQALIFFLVDLAWTAVHVALVWLTVPSYGVTGAGLGLFGSYVFHGLVIYPVVRRLTGFRWSRASARGCLVFLVLVTTVFVGFEVLPAWLAMGLGTAALAFSCVYALGAILELVSLDRVPPRVRRLLLRLVRTSP
jgi:PST family polysaccharide transporter